MKAIRIFLLWSVAALVLYLMFSFVLFDLYSGNWSTSTRYLLVCFSLFSLLPITYYQTKP